MSIDVDLWLCLKIRVKICKRWRIGCRM